MKQFGILFRYECSKVIRRKSFWITMAAVVLFYTFMEIIPIMLVTTSVNTDGGEEFSESYSDKVARDREDGLRLTGRLLDGGLSYGFIMISFVVGVILSQIFAEEHTRKTDQLILCSRLGRKPVYYAKILAGIVMTLAVTFFVLIMIFGFHYFFYGPEGANAVIQQQVGWYSYPLTVGQVILIMILLQTIAALLTAIIVMVLSEWLGNRIAPMVFVIMSLFMAAAVVIPRAYRVFSQIWSYLPMNLVRLEEGICDLRLVSIGGLQLTSWQFGPVVYLVLGILLILLGKRLYCGYQVK